MDQILAKVVSMENDGYQFEAADASFDLLVRKCTNRFQPHFERLHYHVNVETRSRRADPHRSHGQDPHRRRRSATKWPRATAR